MGGTEARTDALYRSHRNCRNRIPAGSRGAGASGDRISLVRAIWRLRQRRRPKLRLRQPRAMHRNDPRGWRFCAPNLFYPGSASDTSQNKRKRQLQRRSALRGDNYAASVRTPLARMPEGQTLSAIHLAWRDFSTVPPLSFWSPPGSSFTCFAISRQVSNST